MLSYNSTVNAHLRHRRVRGRHSKRARSRRAGPSRSVGAQQPLRPQRVGEATDAVRLSNGPTPRAATTNTCARRTRSARARLIGQRDDDRTRRACRARARRATSVRSAGARSTTTTSPRRQSDELARDAHAGEPPRTTTPGRSKSSCVAEQHAGPAGDLAREHKQPGALYRRAATHRAAELRRRSIASSVVRTLSRSAASTCPTTSAGGRSRMRAVAGRSASVISRCAFDWRLGNPGSRAWPRSARPSARSCGRAAARRATVPKATACGSARTASATRRSEGVRSGAASPMRSAIAIETNVTLTPHAGIDNSGSGEQRYARERDGPERVGPADGQVVSVNPARPAEALRRSRMRRQPTSTRRCGARRGASGVGRRPDPRARRASSPRSATCSPQRKARARDARQPRGRQGARRGGRRRARSDRHGRASSPARAAPRGARPSRARCPTRWRSRPASRSASSG